MSTINITGNIQKAVIIQLRSKEIVQGILAAIYIGPAKEDATAAATDFVNHLTLHNEGKVKTACGDNFEKIQLAFADQAQSIAVKLAHRALKFFGKLPHSVIFCSNTQCHHLSKIKRVAHSSAPVIKTTACSVKTEAWQSAETMSCASSQS